MRDALRRGGCASFGGPYPAFDGRMELVAETACGGSMINPEGAGAFKRECPVCLGAWVDAAPPTTLRDAGADGG